MVAQECISDYKRNLQLEGLYQLNWYETVCL